MDKIKTNGTTKRKNNKSSSITINDINIIENTSDNKSTDKTLKDDKKTPLIENSIIEKKIEVLNENKDNASFEEFSMKDLLEYEFAAKIICRKYENLSKRYDNTIMYSNNESVSKFNLFNKIYNKIIDEIEIRIKRIEKFL